MRRFFTLAVYLVIFWMLYFGSVITDEHLEIGGNASLICYSCIGVD